MATTDYYVTTDAMGSVMAVLDEAGNVLERRSYDAFGVATYMLPDGTIVSDSPTGVDVGFQGQQIDQLTGMYQMGYRWYSPVLGRWVSRDPIGLRGGANVVGFVLNRPIDDADALGLKLDAKAMGTLAELFPNEAKKLDKVRRGLLARFDSLERKEANKLLDEALENASKELRNSVITTVLEVVLSDDEFTLPLPNEGPEDLIPKVATAGLFIYCAELRTRYIDCMTKETCRPEKCEQLRLAARRCFELVAAAAKIVR